MHSNIPITFIIPWYGYFAGGAEVAARSLAEQLARRAFPVQVLTTCCRSPFESWWQNVLSPGVEEINDVKVRRFPVNSFGEELYHEVNYRIIHGMDIDEKQQYQYVTNSINSDALVSYANSNTKNHLVIGLPYTQGLIYSLLHELGGRANLMPCLHDEAQLKWVTTAKMFEKSQNVLFLTEEEKTLAIQNFGHLLGRRLVESPVVGVGVELPSKVEQLLKIATARKDVRARYSLSEKFFVYVGRKDAGKNISTLVRYFRDYLSTGGQATLVFLGGGDSNLVPTEEGFLDLGFVSEEDKYLIISEAFGLINLSQNESFSIAIMEAWLCEIPVIVYRGCEVTVAHCRNSNGGIPISSSEEFQVALEVLNHQDIRNSLGKSGWQYVRANYSWNCVIERILQFNNYENFN